jgi:hypothetical protein
MNNLVSMVAFISLSIALGGCGKLSANKPSEDEIKKLLIEKGDCGKTNARYVASKDINDEIKKNNMTGSVYDWVSVKALKILNEKTVDNIYEAEVDVQYDVKLPENLKGLVNVDFYDMSPEQAALKAAFGVPLSTGYCFDWNENKTELAKGVRVRFVKSGDGWLLRNEQ